MHGYKNFLSYAILEEVLIAMLAAAASVEGQGQVEGQMIIWWQTDWQCDAEITFPSDTNAETSLNVDLLK